MGSSSSSCIGPSSTCCSPSSRPIYTPSWSCSNQTKLFVGTFYGTFWIRLSEMTSLWTSLSLSCLVYHLMKCPLVCRHLLPFTRYHRHSRNLILSQFRFQQPVQQHEQYAAHFHPLLLFWGVRAVFVIINAGFSPLRLTKGLLTLTWGLLAAFVVGIL